MIGVNRFRVVRFVHERFHSVAVIGVNRFHIVRSTRFLFAATAMVNGTVGGDVQRAEFVDAALRADDAVKERRVFFQERRDVQSRADVTFTLINKIY